MKKMLIIYFFISVLCGNSYATFTSKDSLFFSLTNLSARYLNYNCSTADDLILDKCKVIIDRPSQLNDLNKAFYAEQVAVNVFCLQGDFDKGISIAKDMYDKAKAENHSLGRALALQAIGATYMYTGLYSQALNTFAEVRPLLYPENDTLLLIRLNLQQLHCCMQLRDLENMSLYLKELNGLIPSLPSDQQDIYLFYISCYETILFIEEGQEDKAQASLDRVLSILPNDENLNIWRHLLRAFFSGLTDNYEQSLIYLDSTLSIMFQNSHVSVYKNTVYEKAVILEKINDISGASQIYKLADSLTDILNIKHYIQQIEDLHLAYYIDQASIENAKLYNKYLNYILLCALIGVFIFIILIITIHKRNKQLTESREKLDEMRQVTADSIQSKSVFLSNMSHDLRTPLNAIVGFSEILTSTEEVDPELKEQCRDYVKLNSDLLMKLVNDIIDFSTLKEAEIKFDFWKYDVVAICRSVVETVAKVKKTEAELSFTSTVKYLEMETDSERLQQVLINLLTNAAKFTETGYIRLLLDFNKQTNEAIFTVEDTGCGIPLEKQARIFERFEKLHDSVQGVGLGLSICKLIISHINGEIWIDSSYTEGARFIFTHPVDHISKDTSL